MSHKPDADKRPRKLLWLDLETTGLDKHKHEILEVAVTVADFFNPFEPTMPVKSWARHYNNPTNANLDPFIIDLHTKNGLFADCAQSTLSLQDIEKLILEFVEHVEDKEERWVIAGSKINFDLGFIEVHMPNLAARLSYRCFDMTSFKLVCRSLGMPKPPRAEAHRAASDILESIAHGKLCRDYLFERANYRAKRIAEIAEKWMKLYDYTVNNDGDALAADFTEIKWLAAKVAPSSRIVDLEQAFDLIEPMAKDYAWAGYEDSDERRNFEKAVSLRGLVLEDLLRKPYPEKKS